jgi:hypothetical protein
LELIQLALYGYGHGSSFFYGVVRVPAQDLPVAIVRSLGGYPRVWGRDKAEGFTGEVPKSEQSGSRQNPNLSYEKQNDCEDRQILRPRIVYAYRLPNALPR